MNIEIKEFPQRIPKINDYIKIQSSKLFLEMESFSNHFVKENKKLLRFYKWAKDPFHTWSRLWEYPFTYSHIFAYLNKVNNQQKSTIRILDGGSGITFFPYYIVKKHPNVIVHALDIEKSYEQIFIEINKRRNTKNVIFDWGDLRELKLKYPNKYFDIIYCISVLEHIDKFDISKVIKGFKKILKKGGVLILTFDIGLEEYMNFSINKNNVGDFLSLINSLFRPTFKYNIEEIKKLESEDIVTTLYIERYNKKLLPWRPTLRGVIGQLLRFKFPKFSSPKLTVFCGVWLND